MKLFSRIGRFPEDKLGKEVARLCTGSALVQKRNSADSPKSQGCRAKPTQIHPAAKKIYDHDTTTPDDAAANFLTTAAEVEEQSICRLTDCNT